MIEYPDYRNMPGPGDEETWGPCVNHPGDPRTPDFSGNVEERREQMYQERLADLDGYFIELFTEASESNLKALSDAIADEDHKKIVATITTMARTYCLPSDEEAMAAIEDDKYWSRYD